MVTRVYRREPITPDGFSRSTRDALLGYLDFDRTSRRATRYTYTGEVINQTEPWSQDFDDWIRTYPSLWTLDPSQAYFSVDPDMDMDEGL